MKAYSTTLASPVPIETTSTAREKISDDGADTPNGGEAFYLNIK